jgi:hypothetical protein
MKVVTGSETDLLSMSTCSNANIRRRGVQPVERHREEVRISYRRKVLSEAAIGTVRAAGWWPVEVYRNFVKGSTEVVVGAEAGADKFEVSIMFPFLRLEENLATASLWLELREVEHDGGWVTLGGVSC